MVRRLIDDNGLDKIKNSFTMVRALFKYVEYAQTESRKRNIDLSD